MRDLREKRRLIERGHLHVWTRQGRSSFHLENARLVQFVLRTALRITGLLARGERNALQPQVRHVTFEIPGLPGPFDGFRILHLSDLHIDGMPALADAICARVRNLKVDLCVFTGDYRFEVEGASDGVYAAMRSVLACVRSAHGSVGVLGNHDSGEKIPHLGSLGLRILTNEAVELKRDAGSLWVLGVDDPHYYGCDDLERTLRGVPEGSCKILLAHSPELYDDAAGSGIALYLCGHTHGGQICLPNGRPILVNANSPRRFAHGRWRHRQMQGYTNAGVGTSIIPVRFNCPPEVAVLELRTCAGS